MVKPWMFILLLICCFTDALAANDEAVGTEPPVVSMATTVADVKHGEHVNISKDTREEIKGDKLPEPPAKLNPDVKVTSNKTEIRITSTPLLGNSSSINSTSSSLNHLKIPATIPPSISESPSEQLTNKTLQTIPLPLKHEIKIAGEDVTFRGSESAKKSLATPKNNTKTNERNNKINIKLSTQEYRGVPIQSRVASWTWEKHTEGPSESSALNSPELPNSKHRWQQPSYPDYSNQDQRYQTNTINSRYSYQHEPDLYQLPQNAHHPDLYQPSRNIHKPYLYQPSRNIHKPYLYQSSRNIHKPYLYQPSRNIHKPYLYQSSRDIQKPYFYQSSQNIRHPYLYQSSQNVHSPFVHQSWRNSYYSPQSRYGYHHTVGTKYPQSAQNYFDPGDYKVQTYHQSRHFDNYYPPTPNYKYSMQRYYD